MIQVTKEHFYQIVYDLSLDMVTDSILPTYPFPSTYPYTHTWKLRYSAVMAKSIDRYTDEVKMHYPIVSTYWITTSLIEKHDKYLIEGECLTV